MATKQPTTEQEVSPSEAVKSATLFVARIGSQIAAGHIIATGLADILRYHVEIVLAANVIGWMTIGIAGLLIFWAQFGYQLAKSQGWTWAANLKWPF